MGDTRIFDAFNWQYRGHTADHIRSIRFNAKINKIKVKILFITDISVENKDSRLRRPSK